MIPSPVFRQPLLCGKQWFQNPGINDNNWDNDNEDDNKANDYKKEKDENKADAKNNDATLDYEDCGIIINYSPIY